MQVYYFVPVPDFNPETFKRNAIQCHTTAQSLVRLALRLQNDLAFLSHAPHFVCRSMLSAACIIISCLISPSLRDAAEAHAQQEGLTPDLVVADALAAVRCCSVQDGDLPVRASKMMESAWMVRNMLPPTELTQLGATDHGFRMGMGLPLDCIRRWKRQMDQVRQEKLPLQAAGGAAAGAGAAGAGVGTGDASGGGGGGGSAGGGADVVAGGANGAGTAGAGAGGAAAMIDWDAFMKDFDWNFDPSLIETVVA